MKARSIGAVLAGIAANVALTLAADLGLSAANVSPLFGTGFADKGLLLLALSDRTLFAGVGAT